MKKISKIESDDDVVLSDSGESVVEHKHIKQPSLNIIGEIMNDISKLRSAISTDSFELPATQFRPCTLQELEEDILNFAINIASHSLIYAISELKAHFERAVGYSDADKRYIVKSIVGKMHGRQIAKENVELTSTLLNKIL